MKFIKNILVMSILLFFIACTAWPALIPIPPGKKKTSIYPIPLPGQTTSSVAAVRIADDKLAALGDFKLAPTNTKTLKAIDKAGAELTSGITWAATPSSIATITGVGVVTAVAIGEATVTATHTTLSPAATVKISVTATGTSILAFDGKEFKQLSSKPTQDASEEK
jgi:hypothetical protein